MTIHLYSFIVSDRRSWCSVINRGFGHDKVNVATRVELLFLNVFYDVCSTLQILNHECLAAEIGRKRTVLFHNVN